MRVRCRYAGNPNGLVDPPCSNITFGETEDYIINITGEQVVQRILGHQLLS